jgi:acetyltransferase-like isoleucine patch superfamily enzyme
MKEVQKDKIFRGKLEECRKSPLKTYMEFTVGKSSFLRFFIYELLICLLGPLPGGAGIFFRKLFYPYLFKQSGKGLIVGRNVVLRHPDKIIIGDNVTIDDNSLIDARGAIGEGLILEDGVIINRNCMIQAKSGDLRLGTNTSIGSNSVIVSISGVEIDYSVLIAGGCYISAGSYHFDNLNIPVMDQGMYSKGPIRIGAGSWLGTCVVVLDGVTIGSNAIIGAGAVVNKEVADGSIAVGVPAKVIRKRTG